MSIALENREDFDRALLVGDPKRPHTARMAGRSAKYIGGMGDRSRTVFLEAALDFAWEHRHSFNTQYESLDMYWERALKAAALSRQKWLVNVAMLPGVFEKRWVLGTMLGKE